MTTKKDPCATVTRQQPNITVNREIAEQIGRDYRTLPIFEKSLYEYTYKKHYSLKTNEYLKCRWDKYKREIEDRVFAPFQFLDIRDYHFYNCRNRLLPALSIHTKTEFRRTLKPGPGVDKLGQKLIPQELHLKRGDHKVQRKSPKVKKTKDNHAEEVKKQEQDKK